MKSARELTEAYRRMFAAFGEQHWWPGESKLEVIVGAVLTQNTNWQNVELAISNLRNADLLELEKLCETPSATLEELIRPAGYFRLKTKRLKNVLQFIRNGWGDVDAMLSEPLDSLRDQLLSVNGVGPETADSILLYAGGRPTFVVDAYAQRIARRHGWIDPSASYEDLKQLFEENLEKDARLFNEYHALIVRVGKDFCKPTPRCDGCPLQPMIDESGIVDLRRDGE